MTFKEEALSRTKAIWEVGDVILGFHYINCNECGQEDIVISSDQRGPNVRFFDKYLCCGRERKRDVTSLQFVLVKAWERTLS